MSSLAMLASKLSVWGMKGAFLISLWFEKGTLVEGIGLIAYTVTPLKQILIKLKEANSRWTKVPQYHVI